MERNFLVTLLPEETVFMETAVGSLIQKGLWKPSEVSFVLMPVHLCMFCGVTISLPNLIFFLKGGCRLQF